MNFGPDEEPSRLKGQFMYNNTASTECNTVDYPLYDPDFYDEECSKYYWCFRYYDSNTCAPESVSGFSEEEVEWVRLTGYYSVYYFFWIFFGFRVIPWTTCLALKYLMEDFADDVGECRLFADFWYDDVFAPSKEPEKPAY
jgi:hypothetical protein